jgi:hypothetical protein
MGILTFAMLATMLAALAISRCRSMVVESALVATTGAIVNFIFDLQIMASPPRPKEVLFYGGGNFALSWLLGFAIAMLLGWVVNKLRGPSK